MIYLALYILTIFLANWAIQTFGLVPVGWGLVAQDGIEDLAVEWGAFDALFMGGSTAYKLSETAYAMVREGKRQGKWCHMGRVNSRRRLVADDLAWRQDHGGRRKGRGKKKQ